MKNIVPILIMFLWSGFALAQGTDSLKRVQYTPDFKFRDGVYLSIEQVKKNQPISRVRIATTIDVEDMNFYGKLLEGNSISLFDDQGLQRDIAKKDVWGFSQNGVLFINYNGDFSRIPVVGSICHFVADKTVVSSPMRFNDPYMNPYGTYYRQAPVATTEQRQYILEFETGQVLDFETNSIQMFLMKDKELLEEFAKLSNKKQRQLKFMYLRKFNEKHPLYLSVTPD